MNPQALCQSLHDALNGKTTDNAWVDRAEQLTVPQLVETLLLFSKGPTDTCVFSKDTTSDSVPSLCNIIDRRWHEQTPVEQNISGKNLHLAFDQGYAAKNVGGWGVDIAFGIEALSAYMGRFFAIEPYGECKRGEGALFSQQLRLFEQLRESVRQSKHIGVSIPYMRHIKYAWSGEVWAFNYKGKEDEVFEHAFDIIDFYVQNGKKASWYAIPKAIVACGSAEHIQKLVDVLDPETTQYSLLNWALDATNPRCPDIVSEVSQYVDIPAFLNEQFFDTKLDSRYNLLNCLLECWPEEQDMLLKCYFKDLERHGALDETVSELNEHTPNKDIQDILHEVKGTMVEALALKQQLRKVVREAPVSAKHKM